MLHIKPVFRLGRCQLFNLVKKLQESLFLGSIHIYAHPVTEFNTNSVETGLGYLKKCIQLDRCCVNKYAKVRDRPSGFCAGCRGACRTVFSGSLTSKCWMNPRWIGVNPSPNRTRNVDTFVSRRVQWSSSHSFFFGRRTTVPGSKKHLIFEFVFD